MFLQGVSCTSTSLTSSAACVAAGSFQDASGKIQTLIEQLSSGTWQVAGSPNSGAQDNRLNGIACWSSSVCFAVGSANTGSTTLIEKMSPGIWQLVPSPTPAGPLNSAVLNGVSCISASNCYAVGDYENSSGQWFTLIEHYSGGTWAIVPSPNAAGNISSDLFGVSCTKKSVCVAVGNGYATPTSPGPSTLIERLAGGVWRIVPSPNPNPAGGLAYTALNGASCTSASHCVAAGVYNTGGGVFTLIEELVGGNWVIEASPNYRCLAKTSSMAFRAHHPHRVLPWVPHTGRHTAR